MHIPCICTPYASCMETLSTQYCAHTHTHSLKCTPNPFLIHFMHTSCSCREVYILCRDSKSILNSPLHSLSHIRNNLTIVQTRVRFGGSSSDVAHLEVLFMPIFRGRRPRQERGGASPGPPRPHPALSRGVISPRHRIPHPP